jgi:hypothetical protein
VNIQVNMQAGAMYKSALYIHLVFIHELVMTNPSPRRPGRSGEFLYNYAAPVNKYANAV